MHVSRAYMACKCIVVSPLFSSVCMFVYMPVCLAVHCVQCYLGSYLINWKQAETSVNWWSDIRWTVIFIFCVYVGDVLRVYFESADFCYIVANDVNVVIGM